MRLAIVGSRSFNDYAWLCECLSGQEIDVIISGGARGADSLGARYAHEHGIPLVVYPAQWELYGMSAGYRRNELIVRDCDSVVAFWDYKSRGTGHTIRLAREMGKPVMIFNINR